MIEHLTLEELEVLLFIYSYREVYEAWPWEKVVLANEFHSETIAYLVEQGTVKRRADYLVLALPETLRARA